MSSVALLWEHPWEKLGLCYTSMFTLCFPNHSQFFGPYRLEEHLAKKTLLGEGCNPIGAGQGPLVGFSMVSSRGGCTNSSSRRPGRCSCSALVAWTAGLSPLRETNSRRRRCKTGMTMAATPAWCVSLWAQERTPPYLHAHARDDLC